MLAQEMIAARILIVDDEPEDVATLADLLKKAGFQEIVTSTESSAAVRLYEESNPDIVLLDLHMPEPDGLQVMQEIYERETADIKPPIVIFTNEVDDAISERVLAAGAVDFIRKPQNRNEVLVRVTNLLENYFMTRELDNQNEILEHKVKERTRDLNQARLETLNKLAIAAEYRDDDTGEHTRRVGRSSALLARAIGMSDLEVERMEKAAALHDVGKIGIPDAILLKPGKLTDDEFKLMQTHAQIGANILAESSSDVLQLAEQIAISHHEKWDGRGYPNKVVGEAIPIGGRIVALADVFDALTNDRPYKQAWPLDEAVAEMQRSAGTHFDPDLTAHFVNSVVPQITARPLITP